MTTDQKPDALPVVAWLTVWNKDRVRGSGSLLSRVEPQPKYDCNQYDPLVRLSDAQASLRAKEADTDRLDWMDKNPGRIKHSIGYRGAPDSWVWTDGNGYGHDAANLRAAIDASRAAADQGGA